MLSVVVTFFTVLLVAMFAIGVSSGGALKGPDAFLMRWTVISAAVLFSAGVAWLRWWTLTRRRERVAASRHGVEPAQNKVAAVPGRQAATLRAAAAPAVPHRRDVTDVLAAAARRAIVFRQHVPPRYDRDALSFFGGAPVAPRGFVWPRSGASRPFSFLMQIDCASVPERARTGLLPDHGVLYFFLDLGWGEGGGFRVLFEPGLTHGWSEIAVPPDLGTAFGKESAFLWNWTQTAEDCPKLLPKWTFDPVAIDVPVPPRDPDEDPESPILWPGDKAVATALREAQGADVLSSGFTIRDFDGADGTLLRPWSAYPHDWRAVQICAGLIRKEVERKRSWRRKTEEADLPPDERDMVVASIKQEADMWYRRAAAQPMHERVPDAEREAFWSWLYTHAMLTRFVLSEAVTLSVEATLAAATPNASALPKEIVERIRQRHALAVRTDTGLFVTTPDRMLAAPSDVQGNQYERAQKNLLLLELSSNEGLGHHFGEGVYQFWIAPDDLKARHFDRVELTTDAY